MGSAVVDERIFDLELRELSSAHSEQTYLLVHADQQFEINERLYRLLRYLQAGRSLVEAVQQLNAEHPTAPNNPQQVASYLATVFGRLSNDQQPRRGHFMASRTLLSATHLLPVLQYVQALFRSPVLVILFGLSLALQGAYFLTLNDADALSLSGDGLLLGYVLSLVSILWHELGHAAACRYYGVSTGPIGMALYLYFPVFYTDVSDSWRLSRAKRCIVDLAGIYFQFIFLLPFYYYYFVYGSPLAKYTIIMVNASMLINLNPFLKFDGYWLLSDALGIPNLRKRTGEAVAYFMDRIKRRPGPKLPYLLQLRPLEKSLAVVYVVFVNVFFVYFFLFRLPQLAYGMALRYPNTVQHLYTSITHWGENPDQSALLALQSFLFTSLILFMSWYVLYSLLKNGVKNFSQYI